MMAPSKCKQISATAKTIKGVCEISMLTSGGAASAQSLPELPVSGRTSRPNAEPDSYQP